jgi:hypothetical protein
MATEREKTKTFKELAAQAGLKKPTIDKLISVDFDTTDVLKLMTDDDIAELEVSKGQTRTLELWVRSMRTIMPESDDGSTEHSADPGAGEHAGLFLSQNGTDDLWNIQDKPEENGRPLFIHDYVSRVSHVERERAVCTQGGTQLVLRSTRQKPTPESVTLAQWVGANARIMAKMIGDGTLKSNQEILDYLDYTMDFGDYAQVNELDSVMLYDHEYRTKQNRKGRKWGEDDIHLANFYLQRKREQYRPRNVTNNRPPRLLDSAGTEICRNYNGNGCYRSQCVFSHVCSICKQNGHARRSHRDQQGHASTSEPLNRMA